MSTHIQIARDARGIALLVADCVLGTLGRQAEAGQDLIGFGDMFPTEGDTVRRSQYLKVGRYCPWGAQLVGVQNFR